MNKIVLTLMVLVFAMSLSFCDKKKDANGTAEKSEATAAKTETPATEAEADAEEKSDESDNKYPHLTAFLTEVIGIVKDHKDNAEEAKKLVAELADKNKEAIMKEGEELQAVVEPKMEAFQKKAMAEIDPKADQAQAMQQAMSGVVNIMKEELPAMGEFIELHANPEYAQVLQVVNSELDKYFKK